MKAIFPRLTVLVATAAFAILIGCGGHSSHQDDNSIGDVTLQTSTACFSEPIVLTSTDQEAFGEDTQVAFLSTDGSNRYAAASVTSGGTANNKLTVVANSSMPAGDYFVLLTKNSNASAQKVGTITYNPSCTQQ